MARDPGSVWSPLPEADQQGSYVKNKFIVHSTGDRGTAAAIYRYFSGATPNESTFVVGRGPEDPTRQLLDSSARADANVSANQSGISVEVVGTADDDYTEWQVSEIVRLGRWSMAHHPIPRQIIPSPTAGGLGWHVMFGAPGPWAGVAKECPGKLRIQRLKQRVFPAIFNDGPTEEFTVAQYDDLMRAIGENHQSMARLNYAILAETRAANAMLIGGNKDGKNNFHWLAQQVVDAVASIPGSQVDVVEAAIAKAVADEIDRRDRERLTDDAAAS